jgi:sulfatase modifying factor 1
MTKAIFSILALAFMYNLYGQTPATIPEKPETVLVLGGTFSMGSNDGITDEKPVHRVTVSSFSIGKYEVTVSQYRAFCTETGRQMPGSPSWGWRDNHPIVNVSWHDCVAYCNWLGEKYGGDWRLPTEAEWEYAARGGNKSQGYKYAGSHDLESVAWFEDNSGGQINSIGRKRPNELGLYDMSGNVWEWCRDWYDVGYYNNSPSSNPRGPSTGSRRVLRGGSWSNSAEDCRVALRFYNAPGDRIYTDGFRVVLSQ